MNSIFQVKIKDEKLNNTIVELKKTQEEQNQIIQEQDNKIKKIERQLMSCKEMIMQKNSNKLEEYMVVFQEFQNSIKDMQQKVSVQVNSIDQKFQKYKQQVKNQIIQIADTKLEWVDQEVDEIKEKISQIEYAYDKEEWVLSLLKNSCFLDFIQILIDKEIESKPKKTKIVIENTQTPLIFNPLDIEEERNEMFNSLKKDISKTQEILKHLKYKVNNKEFERKNHLDLSTLQYATLSAKLTDIQKKIQHRPSSQVAKQKILYPSSEPEYRIKLRRHGSYNPMAQINPIEEEQKKIMEKMEFVNDFLQKKIEKLQNDISNRYQENKETREIIKLYKEEADRQSKKQFEYFKMELLRINEVNLQSHQLKEIYHNIRKVQQKLMNTIELKVEKKQLKEVHEKLQYRINIINESVSSKSNKDQTKQALFFLQKKIKEIVILLVELQNKNSQVAATKKIIQCLSCSNTFFENIPVPQKSQKLAIKRCNTARVLKSQRQKKHNISLQRQGSHK